VSLGIAARGPAGGVLVVSSPTGHQQDDPAMVWRKPRGMDHLFAVLSGLVAGRVRLRRLAVPLAAASTTGPDPCQPDRLALLTLPITPGEYWKPTDGSYPSARILLLLTAKIGLPYFVLAATSPAMQVWFARVYPDRSPYRLYALSNVGSLGALLSYPLLIEPVMATRTQGYVWSALFGVFAVCCVWLTVRLWRCGPLPPLPAAAAMLGKPANTGPSHVATADRLAAVAGVGVRAADGGDQSPVPGSGGCAAVVGGAVESVLAELYHLL
jgi:hypothetical protein